MEALDEHVFLFTMNRWNLFVFLFCRWSGEDKNAHLDHPRECFGRNEMALLQVPDAFFRHYIFPGGTEQLQVSLCNRNLVPRSTSFLPKEMKYAVLKQVSMLQSKTFFYFDVIKIVF